MLQAKKNILTLCLIFFISILVFILSFMLFTFKHRNILKNAIPISITETQKNSAKANFYKSINFDSSKVHLSSIHDYFKVNKKFSLKAKSYILLDANTGAILYEHNADAIIPPASLTKLAALYVLMKNDNFKDENVVVVPAKEAWAKFLPPNSAALGLDEGQQLTIHDLLLGIAVCSGNDAARAAAIVANGSIDKFVETLNVEMQTLGLKDTHFDEPTGLNEKNRTTAKEFAKLSLMYLKKYPENLQKLHSVQFIEYPNRNNFCSTRKSKKQNIQIAIQKRATNTLLQKLEGCDGLKTGFIYESGFNIALTAKRDKTRLLSVILGGEGQSQNEGVHIREQNGTALMEFGFKNYQTVDIVAENKINKKVVILGSDLQAKNSAIIPILASTDFSESSLTLFKSDKYIIEKIVHLPDKINAPVFSGQKIGQLEYRIKGQNVILKTIPLISPATINAGSGFRKFIDGK